MFFKRILPVAITVSIGWLVLISYLLPAPIQIGGSQVSLSDLRAVLVEWGVILAAFALLLGYLNLIAVHFRRISRRQGAPYSAALIIFSALALGYWIGSIVLGKRAPADGLGDLFNWVISPAQSALGALLAIVLAIAGFRVLRVRRTLGMILFVLTAIIVVLTTPINSGVLGDLPGWIRVALIDPITTGGVRGLLLGVALGSLAVGLRILTGADKPQSE